VCRQKQELEESVSGEFEERLREFTIGEIEPQAIVIADYYPAWPESFHK